MLKARCTAVVSEFDPTTGKFCHGSHLKMGMLPGKMLGRWVFAGILGHSTQDNSRFLRILVAFKKLRG